MRVKIKVVLILLLFVSKSICAQSSNCIRSLNNRIDSCLFQNLIFNDDGICEKEIIATFYDIGKAVIFAEEDIDRVLGFIPTTSIAFCYCNVEYYIPENKNISNTINQNLLWQGLVTIKIRFYKDIMEDGQPFALIISIDNY
ncbi:MAG: hypothetical protein LBO06_06725 [Bacteroidales bacterium]|jgi:hypothetical protein|nr:hypothetical protein [Bacteroidales bacterium]